MPPIRVAFWNLQNLFDSTPNEIATDLEFTPAEGWTAESVERKLVNLAEIVGSMFDGDGPDLLGVCELENNSLGERLIAATGRDDLVLAHGDTGDLRGIDSSLIYSSPRFEPAGDSVGHVVYTRFRTRDVFEVPLRVRSNGAELIVSVHHWPSRRWGAEYSEAFRIAVASRTGRLIDEHLKLPREQLLSLTDTEASRDALERRWNRNILLLGDFNDEPYNRSVQAVLKAGNSEDRLEEDLLPRGRNLPGDLRGYLAEEAHLYNAMWPFLGQDGIGTIFYSGEDVQRTKQVFDQIIVSRGLFYGKSGLRLVPQSAGVFAPRRMWTNPNLAEDRAAAAPHLIRPKAFDRKTHRGYSDHFPVQALIEDT